MLNKYILQSQFLDFVKKKLTVLLEKKVNKELEYLKEIFSNN